MNASNIRNMVVLKNLPSNIIDEAIVVLKSSTKVKEMNYIDKSSAVKNTMNNSNKEDYVVKEAEFLISNYISDLEKQNEHKANLNFKLKYNKMKKISILLSILLFISLVLSIIK